ncbi:MAG TPA: SDR family oxidoreductase, partial [Acetobacteraceae bacterium]|nr:SDR family oxidoreductase [Acetobacteraceae bacterium]
PGRKVARMARNGQVAVVTGGSRGIGAAIARRLAARGVAVGINYMAHAAEAEALRAEIIAAGGRAATLQADVADRAAVAAMFAEVETELGPVSILVNNAGISTPATLESYDATALERMRAVNVNGLIHTVRAVMPGMKGRGYGRIVNIASNAAIGTALPGTTFYAATKAEVLILTRRFAMELGRSGITVNAVCPGWIVTDMAWRGATEEAFKQRVASMSERTMVGRVGAPEDIAAAVGFLVEQDAGFITAQVLTVDGGRMDYIGHG